MLVYKVTVDVNVLGTQMKNRIIGNLYGTSIIIIERSRAKNWNTKFMKKSLRSQITSLLAKDIDLYFASV